MQWPDSVLIREVGPRDGLQNEETFLPTEKKIEMIKDLAMAGITAIEVTSFVHPGAVPQLRDAERVLEELDETIPRVKLSALIGNAKGMERALKTPVHEVMIVISASESHNLANLKMTVEESLNALQEIGEMTRGTGKTLRGAVGTSFGCFYQGEVTLDEIKKVVEGMISCEIKEITLADTAGMGNPRQVNDLVKRIKGLYPEVNWALHFHDNRGQGLANTVAGLDAGVTIFESSLGGLGGCPFIPGAAGNVVTEDLVDMLHRMGIATGIDLGKLCHCTGWLERELGRSLPAKVKITSNCKN